MRKKLILGIIGATMVGMLVGCGSPDNTTTGESLSSEHEHTHDLSAGEEAMEQDFHVEVTEVSSSDSSVSYSYQTYHGDTIEMTVDTTDGFEFSSEIPFAFYQNDELLSEGDFLEGVAFEEYEKLLAEEDPAVTILDSGEKDGNKYIFWTYNNMEYDYIILVKDSNTAVAMGNTTSEESARDCFNRTTFKFVE